ncbi:DUF3159 domain-containing protein [Mycobacterium intracellulare]|uniref:DUF3159 domain-containing protein n=1 Tax=Mycobacterium intracellulare TaxID=1767 RepID=UPI000686F50F|nr:DUF3159 domain-containing protein [Mycobacterium intracellulare]AOS94558.1 hypothetical protein AN480_18110 [Mycobacterium intracellulare subsp. chimaera]ARV85206.1 hypothetical protein BWK49_19425 [Mycobacterium intracellulare subsp. chimaera]KPN49971.1 hypothetical protein AN932_13905 [Mycobacterium intracellulare subsp. chimaera]KPN55304.1 hypothetical protein AN931_14680 [Mycobacterium intracellulare subsp. chimaera]KPN55658.1 hypothetical protein AN933_12585 [Mycobacterium intracellula
MGAATPPAREPGSSEQTTSRISPERLLAQAGGVSGVIYSSLPVVVFVIVSSVSGLVPAIAAALGVAALVLLWRLIRRDSPQPALSGFFGVALCALIAYVLGESKGYFLLGIWMSLVWAVVVAASVAIRRPLVGYAWSWATGRGDGWRSVPRAVLAFDIASLGWVLVFTSRFVVQGLLYDADRTGWLAAARIGMGWPLTVLAALATYAAIKSAQRAIAAGAELAPRSVGD